MIVQVWAEPVAATPEPQGCAAAKEKYAAPPSSAAKEASSAFQHTSPEHMQEATVAPEESSPAAKEQARDAQAVPSHLVNGSSPEQPSQSAHPLSESDQEGDKSVGNEEGTVAPHPLLSIVSPSAEALDATSSDPSLHPLLQVSSLPIVL